MKQGLLSLFVLLSMSLWIAGCVSERKYSGTNIPIKEKMFNPQTAAKERLALGLTYLKKGNISQAKYNLDKALSYAPQSEDVHLGLAYFYQTVEDYQRAETAYLKATESFNATGDAKNNFGVYLCKQQKYDQAESMFLAAIETRNYIRVSSSYENLAMCSRDKNDLDKAKFYFEKALNYDPKNGSVMLEYTDLLVELNDFFNAKTVLNRYNKMLGNSAKSLILAITIEQNLGDNESVKNLGIQLLSQFPNSEQAKQYRASLN